MANTFVATRAQLIYALCLPLAVLVGYFLAEPLDSGSLAAVISVLALLLVPIFMRWHHPLLIASWNAVINPYFLPGRPYLWMLMAAISLFFAVLNRSVDPDRRLHHVPTLTAPLVCLLIVVVATALLNGGFASRILGSSRYGGKGYYFIIAAVIGYFALASQRIPAERARLYVALFFLSSLTALASNLAYAGGPAFDFLYLLFPPELAYEQAVNDYSIGFSITRVTGLTMASTGLYAWVLAQFGLRGSFDLQRPWRLAVFALAWLGCALCGFRSVMILFGLMTAAQFYLEGLFRTRAFPITVGLMLLGGAIVLPNVQRLPIVAQRTLSFLPLNIDFEARESADASLAWRTEMWRQVLPQVPRYFFKGKGYLIDANELSLTTAAMYRGQTTSMDQAILAGDYHNGPLSLMIPFGIWGVLAFGWFLVASFRFLYQNFKNGDAALRGVNTFLLGFFGAKLLYFLIFFGGFYLDLAAFVGIVGFSAALNHPVPVAEEDLALDKEASPEEIWAAMAGRRE